MDPVTNTSNPQNLNQNQESVVATDADTTVGNAFADLIGVVELSESPDSVYHYFVASPMYAGFGDLKSNERILFLDGLSRMSPGLKNYFTSADTPEIIFSIGKEYGFEDPQISRLGVLVRELLTGKIFIQDFPMAISSKLGIDDIKAGEIANKIISKSFGPIIEDVKRIQRSKFPDKISQIQKQSQPSGLTQPTARADSAQAARPITPPEIKPATPSPTQPPPTPIVSPTPTMVRPAPPPAGRPSPLPPPPDLKIPNLPPQTLSQPQSSPQPAPKLQFKVPDLDGVKIPATPPANKAQESLEKELEKVASIIDLRNKPKE